MKNMLFAAFLAALVMLAGCGQQTPPGGDVDEHGCIPSAGYEWCEAKQKCLRPFEENCTEQQLIGGDTDAHGCLVAAGYSWCDAKQRCVRTWEDPCVAGTHDYAWAKGIAEASPCMEKGTLKEEYTFNENSLTWWIDMEVADAPGCAPACVVSEPNGEAEINWRCTGALPPTEQICVSDTTAEYLTLEDARAIAQASMSCTAEGTLKADAVCNSGTGTWWIGLETTIPRQGCSPACVVNVNSRTAEINYRCTGLMEGQEPLPAINEGGGACTFAANGKAISLARAREVASANNSACRSIGTLNMGEYLCKSDVGVIWFGITPTLPNEGCSPQCAVNVNSETAGVEWKCGAE